MTDHPSMRLSGDLTMRGIGALHRQHQTRFHTGSLPNTVDLSEVESADSAALALLLEWQSVATRRGQPLQFENPPANLSVIARLTGVAPLLGWYDQQPEANPEGNQRT